MSVGMDGYLSKPLELAKLNELLKDYFEDKIVN
jgi:YesN/AraC family two-component response regulator